MNLTLGDNVPPPKKFSELVNGEEFSFKLKVEGMIKKLKTMDDAKSDPQNFDELMHSFISNSKSESNKMMKMNSKVNMVDNLVKMFIKGNALRAKIMKKKLQETRQETFFSKFSGNNIDQRIEKFQTLTIFHLKVLYNTCLIYCCWGQPPCYPC